MGVQGVPCYSVHMSQASGKVFHITVCVANLWCELTHVCTSAHLWCRHLQTEQGQKYGACPLLEHSRAAAHQSPPHGVVLGLPKLCLPQPEFLICPPLPYHFLSALSVLFFISRPLVLLAELGKTIKGL